MQQWEYTLVTFDGFDELPTELNRLGDDGWEAVAVLAANEAMPNLIVFKRPKEKAWSRPRAGGNKKSTPAKGQEAGAEGRAGKKGE